MSIRPLLRAHTNSILVFLAAIFLGVIIGYFSWGVSYLVDQVGEANSDKMSVSQVSGFNLNAAAALDYRGVLPQAAATSS